MVDSSDEEPSFPAKSLGAAPAAPAPQISSVSVATQTAGTWLDVLQGLAALSLLMIVELNPIREQFWEHILSCIKMPRGGVNGGGSMHCSFDFVAASEQVVQPPPPPPLLSRFQNATTVGPRGCVAFSTLWEPALLR